MKKCTTIFLLANFCVVCSFNAFAQSTNQNYIYSWDVLKTLTDPSQLNNNTNDSVAVKRIHYFDGLGRQLQIIEKGYSPNDKDLIKIYQYNEFGIDTINFQPYTDANSSGLYRDNYTDSHKDFYIGHFNDEYGMAPIMIEKSPLQRVLKQGAPGSSWQPNSHPIIYKYTTNTNSNEFKVKKWLVNGNTCILTGFYLNYELSCFTTIDEDSNTSYEFKDKEGKIVLKRSKLNTTLYIDTYYIYDNFNLLRFVLSPEASYQISSNFSINDDLVKKYVYCYTYDKRNRLIEKRVPGKEVEYYVYNKVNQIILYQAGNMRKTKLGIPKYEWLFTKYDGLGRVILTGITYNFANQSRDQLQIEADATMIDYENLIKACIYPMAYNNYYSNESFPKLTGGEKYLTLNYYDSYSIGTTSGRKPIIFEPGMAYNPSDASFTLKDVDLVFCNGYNTVSYIDFNGTLLPKVNYYDTRGRIIQTRAINHLKGLDINSSLYVKLTSFIWKSEHKHTTLINSTNYNQAENYTFWYDDEFRLKKSEYSTGTLPLQIVIYSYNELGQIQTKEFKEATTSQQNIDYKYNIRGWLTNINDPDNYASSNDFFAMNLYYEKEVDQNISTAPKYNGNISGIKWQTSLPRGISDPELKGRKGFVFNYDNLNRLLWSGSFEEYEGKLDLNNKYFEYSPNYDKNGNIQYMARHGKNLSDGQETIDALTYYYRGNQIIAIDDAVPYNNIIDFYDNGHYYYLGADTLEYFYDANGNLIKDVNKGIINITYNELNLPTLIEKTGNYRLEYEYDALGNKLRQLEIRNGKLYKTTDFVANFVYERNVPAWYNFEEGRVVYNSNGTYFAEKYLKDHLGNVRVAFGNDGSGFGIRQVNTYYPFGMSIRTLTSNSSNTIHRNEYGFNSKMYQDEMGLNLYDYGARFYDPVVARWWSMDPLADISPDLTPYRYAFNNPLKFIDPNGMYESVYEMVEEAWNNTKPGENKRYTYQNGEKKSESSIDPITFDKADNVGEFIASATNELIPGKLISGADMKHFINPDPKKPGENEMGQILNQINYFKIIQEGYRIKLIIFLKNGKTVATDIKTAQGTFGITIESGKSALFIEKIDKSTVKLSVSDLSVIKYSNSWLIPNIAIPFSIIETKINKNTLTISIGVQLLKKELELPDILKKK
jgi:RHS repeat-associated protein